MKQETEAGSASDSCGSTRGYVCSRETLERASSALGSRISKTSENLSCGMPLPDCYAKLLREGVVNDQKAKEEIDAALKNPA